MGWLFVALSVLGFLWALTHHLRLTLINLGVIPPTRSNEPFGGVSLNWAIDSGVDTVRMIAWSIVLLVVAWPMLVTWVVLVWAIAQLLRTVPWLIRTLFEKNPAVRAELARTSLGGLVLAFIGAVVFVVCVYKLGI